MFYLAGLDYALTYYNGTQQLPCQSHYGGGIFSLQPRAHAESSGSLSASICHVSVCAIVPLKVYKVSCHCVKEHNVNHVYCREKISEIGSLT